MPAVVLSLMHGIALGVNGSEILKYKFLDKVTLGDFFNYSTLSVGKDFVEKKNRKCVDFSVID